ACGVTYEVALAGCMALDRTVVLQGLSTNHIQKVAEGFGAKVKRRRKFDLDTDTGVLITDDGPRKEGHAVYLWEGRILERRYTRQQLWLNPAEYFEHYKSVPVLLLEIDW